MKWLKSALAVAAMAIATPAFAQQSAPKPTTLFTNVNVFDGKSEKLATGMSVLVEGNKIANVTKSIATKEAAYADLLLVAGNPLEDLKAVTDKDNLKIIMKGGKIFKNTIK